MRRRGTPKYLEDGVLVANKAPGPTSHDVVERLRRRFKPAKLGHCGTLDPFANGVLVLAFNQATRLSSLLGASTKVYQASLRLGRSTDTGDYTGETTEEAPVPPLSPGQVAQALAEIKGLHWQSPPAFSAAKHQGRPLYAYARQGIKVDKPAKPITISEAELVELDQDLIEFKVRCSQGTYIRSLGEDLARSLDTHGHLEKLVRLESAPFTLEEAVDEKLAQDWTPEELSGAMLKPSQALARCGVPAVSLNEDRVWQLRQGRILKREVLMSGQMAEGKDRGAFRVLSPQGELVAVLRWLSPAEIRSGREYETIRVFPERT